MGTTTIAEILQHIFIERLLINETANIMGISLHQLKDTMRNMEQMGYIKKANSLQDCESCSSCMGCNLEGRNDNQYMITSKGYKLVQNK